MAPSGPHRTVRFPFLIRGGKPSPVGVVLLAAVFTTINGVLQVSQLARCCYLLGWEEVPRTFCSRAGRCADVL